MEIRLISENDDKYKVSRVYEESWKYAYKGIIPQSYLDSIPEGRWVNNCNKQGIYHLIMLDNDSIIGTSSYCKSRFQDTDGFGEIISIYLLPEYIGKGFGKQLLQAAVDGLIELGFRDIFLWVLEDNVNARHFYEKFGFYKTNNFSDDNIGGKNLREIQYRYHIK